MLTIGPQAADDPGPVLSLGSREDTASGTGLAHVEVPMRFTEADFSKKKPPLS